METLPLVLRDSYKVSQRKRGKTQPLSSLKIMVKVVCLDDPKCLPFSHRQEDSDQKVLKNIEFD